MTERYNYAVIDMQLTEEILRLLDAQHYTLAAKKSVATMIATHRLRYGADSIDGAPGGSVHDDR